MKSIKKYNLIITAAMLFTIISCGDKKSTALVDVALVEVPGAKKPAYVPNSLIKRGEFVIVLEKKEVDGKAFSLVQIDGVSTKGWLEDRWIHEGALETVVVIRDSDLFSRPNTKSPKAGRVMAGQVAFQLEKVDDDFSLIQYPGKEAYIQISNLGKDKSQVVKSITIPGIGRANVSATSQYSRGEGKELEFDPRNLFDGSLQTAWCEGKSGDDGVGETVTVNFDMPVTISQISIVSGWTKSEELFNMNNRVSKMNISYRAAYEEGGSDSFTAELQDANYDYQPIFPEQISYPISSLSFRIDGVHKGRDPDTCVSEIKIEGAQASVRNSPVQESEPAPTSVSALAGKEIYINNGCAGCHGDNGTGDGPAGAALNPPPRDLTKVNEFRQGISLQEIQHTISNGIPGTAMVGYSHLSETDTKEIAEWIISIQPDVARTRNETQVENSNQYTVTGDQDSSSSSNSFVSGIINFIAELFDDFFNSIASFFGELFNKTPDSLKAGKEIYSMNCAACHGENGKGDGPAGAALNPPPRDFTKVNDYKNGTSLENILYSIENGIPGTAMVSYLHLSQSDRVKIAEWIVYIQSNN